MRYVFKFPDIGEGLDEGTILEWYIEKGQLVKSGEPLVRMETDKVVTDIPSPKTGRIVALYGNIGETIHVGDALVEIELETAESSISDAEIESEEGLVEEKGAGVVGTLEVAGNNAFLPSSNEGFEQEKPLTANKRKALATPVARALAKDMGIDINKVVGTGPGGRVTTDDVRKHQKSKPQNVTVDAKSDIMGALLEYKPMSQLRKAIARNMTNSKHTAAHMSVYEEAEISELIRIKNKYKPILAAKNIQLSFLPFILKALTYALKKHPDLNAQLDMENERIIYKKFYNIGIAVDTDDGLLVPVIKDVDKLSVLEIAKELNGIAKKARERKISLQDMQNGTFTVTNFGSIGGIYASPVINYPQVGILGIGRIIEKPVFKDDKVIKGSYFPLSLSVDHRIIDGGEVTRFINTLKYYLEDPVSLIFE